MDNAKIVQVLVHHPHWSGAVELDFARGVARQIQFNVPGSFHLRETTLVIEWHSFPADVFTLETGIFYHRDLRKPESTQIMSSMAGTIARFEAYGFPARALMVDLGGERAALVRAGTTDEKVFQQVFVHKEYMSLGLPAAARHIVDIGANVGYASLFFNMQYPKARIIAVEPDPGNFKALEANTSQIKQIELIHGAVWNSDTELELRDRDDSGNSLEEWGYRVFDTGVGSGQTVKSFTMASIMRERGLEYIDILKMDIEGAELEVFSAPDLGWLTKIGLIVIETHERFRPGSDTAVRRALKGLFKELPPQGENSIYMRC